MLALILVPVRGRVLQHQHKVRELVLAGEHVLVPVLAPLLVLAPASTSMSRPERPLVH